MILVDSSAWIEFLRDTGSPVRQRVDDLLADELATCDLIRMELLAGHGATRTCWSCADCWPAPPSVRSRRRSTN